MKTLFTEGCQINLYIKSQDVSPGITKSVTQKVSD